MKKSIVLFALLAFGYSLNAQIYVEGKPLEPDYSGKYLAIEERAQMGSREFSVVVDYGQKMRFGHFDELTDANGNLLKFNSIVAALNFFEENGWTYRNYHLATTDNQGYILLERK